MTTAQVIIDRRFCGPPDSANGGYSCGLLAAHVDGPAEVTLRRPPPLDKPMRVVNGEHGKALLYDGDQLVAEAAPAEAELGFEVPPPPSLEEAKAAGTRCRLLTHPEEHAFPTCFVCGPAREPGDGLRILVGRLEDREVCADVWIPDVGLGDLAWRVRSEFVWAALDCPTIFGAVTDPDPDGPPFVLGRLAVRELGPAIPGMPHIVIGWLIGVEGRKLFGGSALFGDQRLVAVARATWIQLAS